MGDNEHGLQTAFNQITIINADTSSTALVNDGNATFTMQSNTYMQVLCYTNGSSRFFLNAASSVRGMDATIAGDVKVSTSLEVVSGIDVGGASKLNGQVTMTTGAIIGYGYGRGGATLASSGAICSDSDIKNEGYMSTDGPFTVGGGYSNTGTGVTISDTGEISANADMMTQGTLSVSGFSTLSSDVIVGGGFGSVGMTITSTGALSMDSSAEIGSTLTVKGEANMDGKVNLGNEKTDSIVFSGDVTASMANNPSFSFADSADTSCTFACGR
jgi:hypothetical protein